MSLVELTNPNNSIGTIYAEAAVITTTLIVAGNNISNDINNALQKSGGIMSGNIDMDGNQILNVSNLVQNPMVNDLDASGFSILNATNLIANPLLSNLDASTFDIDNVGNLEATTIDLNGVNLDTRLDTDETNISNLQTKTQNQSAIALTTTFTGTVSADNVGATNMQAVGDFTSSTGGFDSANMTFGTAASPNSITSTTGGIAVQAAVNNGITLTTTGTGTLQTFISSSISNNATTNISNFAGNINTVSGATSVVLTSTGGPVVANSTLLRPSGNHVTSAGDATHIFTNVYTDDVNLNGTSLNTTLSTITNTGSNNTSLVNSIATDVLGLGQSDVWGAALTGGSGNTSAGYYSNTSRWVTSGSSGSGGQYSDDGGANWTVCTGPVPQFNIVSDYVPSLGYGIALDYAGGLGNTTMSSVDGITFSILTAANSLSNAGAGDVVFSTITNNFYVYNGTNLYRSPDGITWSVVASSVISASRILITNNAIVTISSAGSQYSTDGITFTQSTAQDFSTACYSSSKNLIIASPSSTNLTNFYYSLDQGITWVAATNLNLAGVGFTTSTFVPEIGRFFFAVRDVTNNSLMIYSTPNYDQPLNGGRVKPELIVGANTFSILRFTPGVNRFFCGTNGNGYKYCNPSYNGSFPQPLKCLQEYRIATVNTNASTAFNFIASVALQLSMPTTQDLSGLGFSVNTGTGVITYSGPTLNFIIILTWGGNPTTAYGSDSLSVYARKNAIAPKVLARCPGTALGIPIGGSATYMVSLANTDTITCFGLSTAIKTVNITELYVSIRALYN